MSEHVHNFEPVCACGHRFVAPPSDRLRKAAQAVMDEWDALGPTGTEDTVTAHRALRDALAAPESVFWDETAHLLSRNAAAPKPVATLHTCWDDHEGPDGTHLDGSPCLDKATPLYAAPEPLAEVGGNTGGWKPYRQARNFAAALTAAPEPVAASLCCTFAPDGGPCPIHAPEPVAASEGLDVERLIETARMEEVDPYLREEDRHLLRDVNWNKGWVAAMEAIRRAALASSDTDKEPT